MQIKLHANATTTLRWNADKIKVRLCLGAVWVSLWLGDYPAS